MAVKAKTTQIHQKAQLINVSEYMKTRDWFNRNRFFSIMRIAGAGVLAIAAAATGLVAARPSSAAGQSSPANNRQPVTHQHINGVDVPLTQSDEGVVSARSFRNPPSPICSTTTSSATNVNADCELIRHNETTIAINPANALNQIGSVNDQQILLTSGGTTYMTRYARAHVTFDGGMTWTIYPINYNSYDQTADPAVAFDADGTAYLATVAVLLSQNSAGIGVATAPDIIVTHSTDGGRTWTHPVRAASGSGGPNSPGVINDKDYIAAWGHGNAIVTWTVFNQGIHGSYISSAIFASVTHDAGKTWSRGVEISGSAAFCVGAQGGTQCDQDQLSVPAVAADGSIYVAFENTPDTFPACPKGCRDQYLVVKVDPTTGARVAGPYQVATIYDGITDYPINIDGLPTYQDSEFRSNSGGNIVADPTNANHLAVIWSDMRNGTLPAPADPYSATTNSDIIVSQSFDGGVNWSAPVALIASGDQFQPWGAYDASGKLRIGYYDRSYDAANHKYGYTMATETSPGMLTFLTAQLTTELSDPTKNTRWFSVITVNPNFPHPTTFLGDYSGLSLNGTAALWTDMRNNICFNTLCGAGEDAFYAAAP
jgi:hypothetical protein